MLFTKMHGLGNDFIHCQDVNHEIEDYAALATKLCNRNTGIGADGLIVACPSETADVRMRIINADGSEAEMCGNGIRCFAQYCYTKGIITTKECTVETLAGIMKPTIKEMGKYDSLVTVDMGVPHFRSDTIPMNVDMDKVIDYEMTIDGHTLKVSEVLMGVPHAVVFVDSLVDTPITTWGPLIEKHDVFPKGTNVNFVEPVDDHTLRVRTWERGAGPTLACGTGCSATTVIAYEKGYTADELEIQLALGSLYISYDKNGTGHVFMTGPAVQVFETELPPF